MKQRNTIFPQPCDPPGSEPTYKCRRQVLRRSFAGWRPKNMKNSSNIQMEKGCWPPCDIYDWLTGNQTVFPQRCYKNITRRHHFKCFFIMQKARALFFVDTAHKFVFMQLQETQSKWKQQKVMQIHILYEESCNNIYLLKIFFFFFLVLCFGQHQGRFLPWIYNIWLLLKAGIKFTDAFNLFCNIQSLLIII